MAIDFSRVIQAAAEAALEGRGSGSQPKREKKRRGPSIPRAFLIGAGVVTAGRLVAASRGRDMLENLQQRLVDYEHEHFDDGDDEEPYDEEPYDDYDEEPEGEEDEDFDEDGEEAEEDEDFEEEPEAEEDEDFDEEDEEAEPGQRRRARAGSSSNGRAAQD